MYLCHWHVSIKSLSQPAAGPPLPVAGVLADLGEALVVQVHDGELVAEQRPARHHPAATLAAVTLRLAAQRHDDGDVPRRDAHHVPGHRYV